MRPAIQSSASTFLIVSGIISLVVDLTGGQAIEAAMIGCDSVMGGSLALGGDFALNKGIVQAPGAASDT